MKIEKNLSTVLNDKHKYLFIMLLATFIKGMRDEKNITFTEEQIGSLYTLVGMSFEAGFIKAKDKKAYSK